MLGAVEALEGTKAVLVLGAVEALKGTKAGLSGRIDDAILAELLTSLLD